MSVVAAVDHPVLHRVSVLLADGHGETPPIKLPGVARWPELRDLTVARPILLSDDTPGMMNLYRALLQDRCGLTVLTCIDPADVLVLCHNRPLSLVISDIKKPRMSGFELLRRLRADPATVHLPFFFVTARPRTLESLAQGGALADDYLVKPFDPAEFIARVQRLLLRWL